jgi:multidrug efflux pump subunit AcrB
LTERRDNLAGRLAGYFITSKLTIVLVVAVLVVGALATLLTPREENPQIVVPAAQIIVTLPGASAKEVERLVVTPLEGVLSELTGVDHTYAVAQNSAGVVEVQFKVGQPKEASLIRLYDRVMSNLSVLPKDAGTPQIRSIDADDVPIVAVTLASRRHDDYALKRLADSMAERLHSLDDVSVVQVRGGHDRRINVEIDPERLHAFGLSLSQLSAAFAASNLSMPLSDTVTGDERRAIKLIGQFVSADDVRNQIIAVHDGRPVTVGDVADVIDGPPPDVDQLTRFAFGAADQRFSAQGAEDMAAVTVTAAKKKGANAVVVADNLIDRVQAMKAAYAPADVEVVVTRNDGQKADEAVNRLLEHLGVSVAAVSLVLIAFLGWREALIVSLTIPLVLSTTLAVNALGGVTINRVTLFGLIIALGMLVDAGIVVIENIHRRFGETGDVEQERRRTVVDATNEIGAATTLATFAVMLVFAANFMISGMPGEYFYPVSFGIPVTMGASMLVAYVVIPWAAKRWLPRNGANAADATHAQRSGRLRNLYLAAFRPLQIHRWARIAFCLAVVALMVLSSLQGAWRFIRAQGVVGPQSAFGVDLSFMIKNDQNAFDIVVSMPETAPVEDTARIVRQIVLALAPSPYVENVQSWVGMSGVPTFTALMQGTADRSGSYVGEVHVNLIDKDKRNVSSIALVREWRPKVVDVARRYPGAKVRFIEDPPGPPPIRATVFAELYGPDAKGLRALSAEVEKAFLATDDIVDVSDSEPVDVPEFQITPDKDKAALSAVSVAQIAGALGLVYGGQTVSRAHLPDEKNPIDVRAYVPRRLEVPPARLDRVFVQNLAGGQAPLSELASVRSDNADRPIQRQDDEIVSTVGGELARSSPIYALIDLNRRLSGIVTPDGGRLHTGSLGLNREPPNTVGGYELLWEGEMRMMLDVYRDLTVAMGAALMSVYLLLVAYYRSFVIPLIAIAAVPFGLIGIFPGHWLMGQNFTVTSMIGIVALSGVVIRASLLIIDFILDYLRQGRSLDEATRLAGAVRLRPIMLTTLAVVLGSAIMIPDPVFGGLAISLIFGTMTSSVLTLFVVPLLFEAYAKRRLPAANKA